MRKLPDSEIEQKVLRELSLDERICSREICVLARNGMLSIQGTAQSSEDKLAVEESVKRVTDIAGIVNELVVTKPNSSHEKTSANASVDDVFAILRCAAVKHSA